MGGSRVPVSLRNAFSSAKAGPKGSIFAIGTDLYIFQRDWPIGRMLIYSTALPKSSSFSLS